MPETAAHDRLDLVLDRIWNVDELVREAETGREVLADSADAEALAGVMADRQEVDPVSRATFMTHSVGSPVM